MNGVALMVAAAVLGVDYGWQPTADGQLEYIIQIEPVTLVALRGGQELISQIDPYVRGVRRFRIQVGTDMVPRRGTPPRQPAPPQGLPIPSGVQYGWRGIDNQQMEFIIQLSHERLVLMRGGEDLVGEIPPEVQQVTQLRIRSGVEPPPRQGLQVASANLPAENPSTVEPPGTPTPGSGIPPADGNQQPGTIANGVAPPESSPPRMEMSGPSATVPPPNWQSGDVVASPPTGHWSGQPTPAEPLPQQPGDAAGGYTLGPNATATGSDRAGSAGPQPSQPTAPMPPAAPVADPRFENAGQQPPAGPAASSAGSWQTGPVVSGVDASNPSPLFNPAPVREPGRGGFAPNVNTGEQNPAAPVQGGSIYGGTQLGPPSGASQPAPPTVQIPSTPQWSSGDQSEWTVAQPPGSGPAYQPPASPPLDMSVAPPRMPWERRLFLRDTDMRINAEVKDFWANLAATAQDPSLAYLHSGGRLADGDRPWGPLALTLMVLFVSLGANLYMGWIATDMYRRYLDLADDLAERDSPSRTSLDHHPLDDDPLDDDDWEDARRRRHRSTIAA